VKIGDAKVGAVLALDASERYSRHLPRKVEVLDIVTVEEEYWQRTGGFHSKRAKRKVRRAQVKFLDAPTGEKGRYDRFSYQAEKEGATRIVESKQLVAPWAEVAKDVDERVARMTKQATAKAEAESRLVYLFGKKMEKLDVYVTVTSWNDEAEIRISGDELDTLLTLAERGKKAVE
jgi:hypothetical protein